MRALEVGLVVCGLLACACSASVRSAEVLAPPPPPPRPVQLVHAGQPPLRLLRYSPRVGDHTVRHLDIFTDLGLTVTQVSQGIITMNGVVKSQSPTLAEATANLAVSDRGIARENASQSLRGVRHPWGVDDSTWTYEELTQAFFEQPVFPEEPVGVGARWVGRRQTYREGFKVDMESSYELVEMHDDECVVVVETTFSTEHQPFGIANQGSQEAFEVVKLAGTGRGRLTISLSGIPFPRGVTRSDWTDEIRTDRRRGRIVETRSEHKAGSLETDP